MAQSDSYDSRGSRFFGILRDQFDCPDKFAEQFTLIELKMSKECRVGKFRP